MKFNVLNRGNTKYIEGAHSLHSECYAELVWITFRLIFHCEKQPKTRKKHFDVRTHLLALRILQPATVYCSSLNNRITIEKRQHYSLCYG